MPRCKHIIQASGLFCQNNSSTLGYCRTHYEKRLDLTGYSFDTTTVCQLLFRGNKFCTTPSVPGLLNNMCQSCYDKAKAKRKVLIDKQQQEFEEIRALIVENIQTDYNIVLTELRNEINGALHVPFEPIVDDIYHHVRYSGLSLEQKRNLVHELEVNLYPTRYNLIPNRNGVERLQEWCEDMDMAVLFDRPSVSLAIRPAAPPTLQQIASDGQNVHTAAVVQQSNTIVDKLLALAAVTTGLDRIPDFFASKWLLKKYGAWEKVRPVVNDMSVWYNTSFCKQPGDWLYRRVLNGLFVYMDTTMKNKDIKREVLYRIFQECRESVGQCCEGHISRLANALVGFDEEAKPQISAGELLQHNMAQIATQEVPLAEKLIKARILLNEMRVPESEHQAWLDAF